MGDQVKRPRGWLRFVLTLLVTVAVLAGLGVWRAQQHGAFAWSTIQVGESIERQGLSVEAISLAVSDLAPSYEGSVWVELVIAITPTSDGGLRVSCDKSLHSGRDQWQARSHPNEYPAQPGTCAPTDTEPPLVIGQPRQVHNYFEVPAVATDEMSAVVEFYDPSWAVRIKP